MTGAAISSRRCVLKRMSVRFTLLVAVLAISAMARPAFAQNSPVSVYVFSAPSPGESGGFTDRDSEKTFKQRDDSVQDIKKALEGKRNVRVVESAEEARIRVEVASRSSFGFNPFAANAGEVPIVIQARLTVDDYSLGIVGRPSPLIRPGWKGAAENVARQIEEWIRMNRDRLQ